MKHISFQLTASRRGWLFFLMKQLIWLTFQLTASRRGWPGLRFFCRTSWYFNSQPHEEADCPERCLCRVLGYFNSQPHEEADERYWIYHKNPGISTHSLTKRLTYRRILADARTLFQLTASRRGWHLAHAVTHTPHWISTHSLTNRLTVQTMILFTEIMHFNSQPHEEADYKKILRGIDYQIFQLTASRRGWRNVFDNPELL